MVRTSRGGYWVLATAAVLALSAGSANAAVITFEGTASGGAITVETNSTTTFSGFDVFVGHGHYVDSAHPTFASNGTDWLMHDHNNNFSPNVPVTITRSGGGTFTFNSIDTSESVANLGTGHTLTLTGHVFGGGTLVANFLTDNVFGFQTFSVGAWLNLVSLDIIGSSSTQGSCANFTVCGALGYDNIVVDATVPEPASLSLLGLGLVGLYRLRRRA